MGILGRGTVFAVAVTLATAAVATVADADPVQAGRAFVIGNTLYYVAEPGVTNLVMTRADGLDEHVITDGLRPIQAGPGCQPETTPPGIRCRGAITAVHLDVGDLNDFVDVKEPMGTSVFGGPGNDTLHGDGFDDLLDGGPGDDELTGGPGDDELRGGPGNDTVHEGLGVDLIDGGDGYDTVDYRPPTASSAARRPLVFPPPIEVPDTIATDVEHILAGHGRYRLTGTAASEARVTGSRLSFAAAAGRVNDVLIVRARGFGHVVTDLVPIIAGDGCRHPSSSVLTRVWCADLAVTAITATGGDLDDHLRNDTEIPSTLSGGIGDDLLDGGPGDDHLDGGPGTDRLNGGPGADTCVGGESTTGCVP